MSKLRILLTALVAVAALAAVPASASASYTWQYVGDCTTWSHNPDISASGWVRGWGQIGNCGSMIGHTSTEDNIVVVESCLEKNPGSGWSGTYNCTSTGAYTDYSNGQQAGCGTWFRTWSWFKDDYQDGLGWHGPYTAAYVSPADYWC